MINLKSKIYVAGHKGLVGSAIIRKLKKKGYKNIIFRSKKQLDLKNQKKVYSFLKRNKPDFIFMAAAKVGGIYSNNKYRAEFIHNNLSIQTNAIAHARFAAKLFRKHGDKNGEVKAKQKLSELYK